MTGETDNPYLRFFREIAEEVVIEDAFTFTHARFGTLEPPRDMAASADHPVVTYLAKLIYLSYYAGDDAAAQILMDGGKAVATIPDYEDYPFSEQLHGHNTGRGHLTPGWRITGHDGQRFLVHGEGITLSAAPQELVAAEPDGEVKVGALVSVRFPPSMRYALLGWYMAIGDQGVAEREDGLVRIYFSLDGHLGAPVLMKAVTSTLNALEVPFQFKMANHPAAYHRRDAGVLFLSAEAWSDHRTALLEMCAKVRAVLRDDYPRLALPLAFGVSFAVEPHVPGRLLSFGEHRCLLVAEALVQAHEQGVSDAAGRLAVIRDRYAREGLSMETPYAEPVRVP
ncbi:T3SS effector HopA1 family protein [Nonomuraea aurantiaca]|uniref:T3SS effector HopA1 family protein n=1 Tax=Nonomuraea aurantiaca TaxID=2878562 RepID=UPI001CD921D1|nr:T3SS effector HopA1 family protein [Nonomuraea aurantiaca]MCA2227189.1 hypothetical protein [Nonomuraea aurantiaca]